MPNCLVEEARCSERLDNIGLKSLVRREESATAPAGAVLRTDPPVGTMVKKGAVVLTIVSDGLRIPADVLGRTEKDVVDVLIRLGLRPSVINEQGGQAGLVTRTIPQPGTVVQPGETVQVVVATG